MDTITQLKVCSKCKVAQPLTNFYKDKDKLRADCKTCNGNKNKKYYVDKVNSISKRLYRSSFQTHLKRKKNGRDLEFTITTELINELLIKQNHKCYWTKLPLNNKWKKARDAYAPSLDRLDNSKGYTPDNICITTWVVNRMRGNLSVEEFTDLLNNIKAA